MASLVGAAPALGLIGLSAVLGGLDSTVGAAGSLVACFAALAAGLVFLEPIVYERLGSAPHLVVPHAAGSSERFVARALAAHSLDQLAPLVAAEAERTLGAARARLLVADATAKTGVRILGGGAAEAPSSEGLFDALTATGGPVGRAALPEDEGGQAARALMEQLDAHLAVPLVQRGALVGVLFLGGVAATAEAIARARRLAAGTTVALTSLLLREAAQGVGSLAREVGLATAVQEALLPDDRPQRRGDLVVRGLAKSASECGGDLWMCSELANGRWLVLVGDVTGHGAPAAMLAAVAKGATDALRLARGGQIDPGELLETLGRVVHGVGKTKYFMTAFALVVEATHAQIRFANAGHEFPYLMSSKGVGADGAAELHRLIARGDALGTSAHSKYQSETRAFAPGERIVLYTDGAQDVVSENGDSFGEKRLRRTLAQLGSAPIADVVTRLSADLERHRGSRPLEDDYTLVIVGREEAGPA